MNVLEILQTLLALSRTAIGSAEWDQMCVALWQEIETHFSKRRFYPFCSDVDKRISGTLEAWERVLKKIPTWAAKGESANDCVSYFYRKCKDVHAEHVRGNVDVIGKPTKDIHTLRDKRLREKGEWVEDDFVDKIAAQDFYNKFMPKLEQAKEELLLEGDVVRWRQWEAWELFYLHDCKIADIAAKLDVTKDTVKSDLFIVRRRFGIWLLREVEELSYSEIAERVNASVAIVRKEATYMRKHFGGLLG